MNIHFVSTVGVDLTPLVLKWPSSPVVSLPGNSRSDRTLRNLRLLQNQTSCTNMQTIGEIIPFAKEVLNQRPNWGMVKIYTLGSTLAMLGLVSGLVETVLLPFAEQEPAEDAPVELVKEKREDREVWKSHTTFLCLEVVDVLETVVLEARVKLLVSQPPAFMLHKETLVS
ncbi:G0/G1 switch protein 2 [Hippoglossus stenolepis]|uniref:G0/G1 switch protein 2 n=1 Tax=Hippoglossus stenolepis TaxID=195615 RepID=UPI00159CAF16|nr:G0/G1 switch protein 2 [Hippoglossus stenolepis]